MKNVQKLLGIVLMFSLLFAACSKSADPVAAAATLVGTWKNTTVGISGCTGTLSILNSSIACPSNCTWVFTATTIAIGTSGAAPYTTSGSTLSITSGGTSGTFTYVLTATSLVLTQDAATLLGPGCKTTFTFTK